MIKKEYKPIDALNTFKDIWNRANISDVYQYSNIIFGRNQNNQLVLFTIEPELLKLIIKDEIYQNIKEIDFDKLEAFDLLMDSSYGKMDSSKTWFPINDDKLYNGEIIELKILDNEGKDRVIQITKEYIPVRLKKAEFKELYYTLDFQPIEVIIIRKYFLSKLKDYGFHILAVYKII